MVSNVFKVASSMYTFEISDQLDYTLSNTSKLQMLNTKAWNIFSFRLRMDKWIVFMQCQLVATNLRIHDAGDAMIWLIYFKMAPLLYCNNLLLFWGQNSQVANFMFSFRATPWTSCSLIWGHHFSSRFIWSIHWAPFLRCNDFSTRPYHYTRRNI